MVLSTKTNFPKGGGDGSIAKELGGGGAGGKRLSEGRLWRQVYRAIYSICPLLILDFFVTVFEHTAFHAFQCFLDGADGGV